MIMRPMRGSIKKIMLAILVFMTTTGFLVNDRSITPEGTSPLVVAVNLGEGTTNPFDHKALKRALRKEDKIGRKKEVLIEDYDLDPRHLFPDRRDPFVPLVTETKTRNQIKKAKKARRKAAVRATRKFTEFGSEIKSLKPIPVELYRKIGEHNPNLYATLESYGRLFREKARLQKLTVDSYLKKVRAYRRLIKKANHIGRVSVKTPLQARLKALRLVGIVRGGPEPVALIETSGNKGHTIRKGVFVGPNFGVVESIDASHINILERNRDFRGNIKSNIRKIKLAGKPRPKQERS